MEVEEGGWAQAYVTSAWHGRHTEPQMCVKLSPQTLFQENRRREESAGSLYDATAHHIESGTDSDRVRTCLIHTI